MDKAVIIGDSPFLREVEDKVNYVAERYFSLGINRAINFFKVQNHIFTDFSMLGITNKYYDVHTISLLTYGDLVRKRSKELINTFTYKGDYVIKNSKGHLAWCGFTHDYAISYCISKGAKEIYLIGAADFEGLNHYSSETEFKRSSILQQQSINFIKDCANQYVDIFTCNPNSVLEEPYIKHVSIEELLV